MIRLWIAKKGIDYRDTKKKKRSLLYDIAIETLHLDIKVRPYKYKIVINIKYSFQSPDTSKIVIFVVQGIMTSD